jgi:hypothetical protein
MKKYNNFLITGFGRSGTNFLSTVMNKSNQWTVNHEPRGSYEEKLYKNMSSLDDKIINDFSKDNYGEVNSRMRFFFNDINVNKKGIILRDTKDIIKSVANRKSTNETIKLVGELNYFWKLFNEWLSNDTTIFKIDFTKMTTDIIYLKNILTYFGVNDVIVTENIINKKINTNSNNKYKTYEDLPKTIRSEYDKLKW